VFTPRVLNIQELRRNKPPDLQAEIQAKASNPLEGQTRASNPTESQAKAASQLDVYANKSLVIQNKKVPAFPVTLALFMLVLTSILGRKFCTGFPLQTTGFDY